MRRAAEQMAMQKKTSFRQKMNRPESVNEKPFQQDRCEGGIDGAIPIEAFSVAVLGDYHAKGQTCNQHAVRFENE